MTTADLNLPNIVNADGLAPDERDELDVLTQRHASLMARNTELLSYYECKNPLPPIGIDTVPDNVKVDTRCGWAAKAVRAVSDRSHLEGFDLNNSEHDETLERVVSDNAIVAAYNRCLVSELIHGVMFATVGRQGNRAAVRFHSAETACGLWDYANERIGSGYVIAATARTPWSTTDPVPVQVNLHLPRRVVVITRTAPSRWVAESMPTPIDRPMMEAFAYNPSGTKPLGESRITKTVMDLCDACDRTLADMALSSALYAAPQKYLFGLTEEQFDAMTKSKWSTYIGNIVLATRDPDTGDVPEYGQLPSNSPQPYIDQLRTYAMMFSGATGVPINSLGIIQDNPSSADAIQAAREDVCLICDRLNEASAVNLRELLLMSMAVHENTTVDKLTDGQRSVMARFSSTSMPSASSQADAASKIASADPTFGGTDAFYRLAGLSRSDIESLKSQRAQERGTDLIRELTQRRTYSTGTNALPAVVTSYGTEVDNDGEQRTD